MVWEKVGLLWILEHRSPWVQAPILKKKEQFTLSFSVPKILARYSAIIERENLSETFKIMRGRSQIVLNLQFSIKPTDYQWTNHKILTRCSSPEWYILIDLTDVPKCCILIIRKPTYLFLVFRPSVLFVTHGNKPGILQLHYLLHDVRVLQMFLIIKFS